MYQFGSGSLWATPIGSFTGPNPTPLQFGTLQDVSFDISGTMKELYGRKMLPDDVKRAQVKITGKAKSARIFGKLFNDIFWGQTFALGNQVIPVTDEADSVPGTSTYTITVTNHATFKEDLGVVYSATGARFTKVASLTAVGQYTVDITTGIYTFYSGDASAAVLISYTYTGSGTTGNTLLITNQAMGQEPTFLMTLANKNAATGQTMNLKFFSAKCNKLTFASKNEDFTIPEFDFTCFADAGGNVMEVDMSE